MRNLLVAILLGLVVVGFPSSSGLLDGQPTSTGKAITPTAAAGAFFQELPADRAAAVAVSPDGRTLAVLTSGDNRRYGGDDKLIPALSTEYVFLFDITGTHPRQTQVLPIPNSFQGLVWTPDSSRLYAAGGKDDVVYEFSRQGDRFAQTRTLPLGHGRAEGVAIEALYDASPLAGALAISPDGTRMLVANMFHDSVSLIDLVAGRVVAEQDLRPGGTYPRSVVWISNQGAYVASERDREIISLAVAGHTMRVTRRLPVQGQPVALLARQDGSRIYAALDNTDVVAVVDTTRDVVIEQFPVVAPESVYINSAKLGGANANALALTPDERTLLVSNGGQNAIAVVRLGDGDHDDGREERSTVVALVPTGWYPAGVTTSKDGSTWYVINGKSMPGANASWCSEVDPVTHKCPPAHQEFLRTRGQTVLQLQRGGLLSMPAPPPLELARLTKQVARNNGFDRPDKTADDERLFAFLKAHIKHVIYVIKENRTYDQILGDLEIGNGDPRLALFGNAITPNQHALSRGFVTLDNFLASGEGSWTGWQWSTAARTTDYAERTDVLALADRGGEMAIWGLNRGMNTIGARDVGAPDGPGGEEGKGYIWDSALRAGLSVRNYGFFGDVAPIWTGPGIARVHDPFASKLQVFSPANASLAPYSDRYYRTFDFSVPDYWRIQEWKREYRGFVASGTAPALMLVQLGNNHTGDFEHAIDGVNTPETQVADNDYALGQLVEAVAAGPFADSTLIISIEDDTWDGPDHVDAFRSPAFFAGAYVRHGALVSTRYTTVSVLKTIEAILGIGPVGLNDALAAPMSDIFDRTASKWSYKAIVPTILRSTQLPLPDRAQAGVTLPRHSARYWAKAMAGRDSSHVDAGEFGSGNRELWRGLKGDEPYPETRTGEDLRANRSALLQQYRR